MTQIRFTSGDPDTLKAASQVLRGVRKQMAKAIEGEQNLPEGAYHAISHLEQTALTLENWASLIETDRWKLLLERSP